MPFKHNALPCHCIPKVQRRLTNWPVHEAGLRRRGDLILWLDEAASPGWSVPRRTTRGGQPLYSDMAIALVPTLRLVFIWRRRRPKALHARSCARSAWIRPCRITPRSAVAV